MEQGHFDYKSVSEESESLDFGRLLPCPHCKKPIPHDATMCLYCGQEVVWGKKSPWFSIVVIILIVALLLFFLKSA
ncbi:MAG: hypothetical protein KAS05_01405 [Candidatus Omnitrophica bacterium]|nr:hypothetical protein [Candidatus Omnitrophota bacterium]